MRTRIDIRLGKSERDRVVDEFLSTLAPYKQSAFVKDLLYAVAMGTLEGFSGDLTLYAEDPQVAQIDDRLLSISFASLRDR